MPPKGGLDDAAWLELKVTSSPQLCGRLRSDLKATAAAVAEATPKPDGGDGTDDAPRSAASRQYCDEHAIMPVIQGMLEALLREQPADPLAYINKFMSRLARQPEESGEVARTEHPEASAAFDAADSEKKGCLNLAAFCDAILSLHPRLSTAQAEALGQGVAPGAAGVTLAAFSGAASPVAAGDAMAAEVAGLSEQQFVTLGSVVPTEERPTKSAASPLEISELDRLRSALENSASCGNLEEMLQRCAPPSTPAPPPPAPPPEPSCEDMLRRTLEESMSSGALTELLQKCTPPAVEKFRNLFELSARSGALEEALKAVETPSAATAKRLKAEADAAAAAEAAAAEAAEQREMELTGEKARIALSRGVESGVLSDFLMARSARNLFEQSASSGRLEELLKASPKPPPPPPPRSEEEVLMDNLKSVLEEAAGSGRLEGLLKSVQQKPPPRTEEQMLEDTLRSFLEASASSGALEEMLKAERARSEQARLTEKAKTTLEASLSDGRLAEALKGLDANAEAPPASAGSSRSAKHAELLEKQHRLEEENKSHAARLEVLEEKKAKPSPAAGASKTERRGQYCRELREANQSLSQENARLNAELVRLLARAGVSSATH
eukprot:NODE_2466_length_2207_cov_4.612019.p1 GENE.NODE_2466_length_2207_cov_4.612019~~NODE_2466_length_2207_cov_4.612019.p1  ORF type:complete len:715 (-),score=243.12 NODE_2466_length_2207_cov_4.612019:62-1897(-)